MDLDALRIQDVFCDLGKPISSEKALKALTMLSEIISSSRKELEFLHKEEGLCTIISLMENDSKLVEICLKIFVRASKKNVKIRKRLLKSNIFHVLRNQLQNENDFAKNIALYSVLIVTLVQGNSEAQNQMQSSECLLTLNEILSQILDEDCKNISWRSTELIIYAITVCFKDPWHRENQTEVGWMLPKVLVFLEKQNLNINIDYIQLVKCFWSFLRSVLHKSEVNQKIFLSYSGSVILFRRMQEILEDEKFDEMGDLLSKMTAVLIKLTSRKEFLYLASNYCCIIILCGLLQTSNSLVLQHIITFLDSLTRVVPHALSMVEDKQILKGMNRAKIILLRCEIASKLYRDVWKRTKNPLETRLFVQNDCGILRNYLNAEHTADSFCDHCQICPLHNMEPQKNFLERTNNLRIGNSGSVYIRVRNKKQMQKNRDHFFEMRNKKKKIGFLQNLEKSFSKIWKKFWLFLFRNHEILYLKRSK